MGTEFISGPLMYITWTYNGGTTVLSTDYTTCAFNTTSESVDITNGADTMRRRLTTFKDATVAITSAESTGSTGGTAAAATLSAGNSGTLLIYPGGTATGNRKLTIPAVVTGANYSWPFGDKAEYTVNFQLSAAYTEGVS